MFWSALVGDKGGAHGGSAAYPGSQRLEVAELGFRPSAVF